MKYSHFPDYASTMHHLDARGMMRINPSQNAILYVLEKANLLRPQYKVIQVVGTNGKGSTSSMLASLCSTHGHRTGLFTSPHFVSPRERIKINGQIISEESWTRHANRIMPFGGDNLSYFEFITVLALSFFDGEGVSFAIMEAGLGGTWDATSAIASDLTVITPIALDHCSVLGNTITEIAKDKSGAIRKNTPVCSAVQTKEAWAILTEQAKEKSAPLYSCKEQELPQRIEDGSVPMLLSASFQKENAKLAVLSWNIIAKNLFIPSTNTSSQKSVTGHDLTEDITDGSSIAQHQTPHLHEEKKGKQEEQKSELFPCGKNTSECVAEGLSKAWIPGRLQHIPAQRENTSYSFASSGWPALVLDAAHNEHGMQALGLSLAKKGIAPLATIFACLEDKDPERIYPHLRALSTGAIFVPPIHDNPRAMSPEKIAKEIGVNATPTTSMQEALQHAFDHMKERMPEVFLQNDMQHPLLICGSLYLLGEFYELRPDLLEPLW